MIFRSFSLFRCTKRKKGKKDWLTQRSVWQSSESIVLLCFRAIYISHSVCSCFFGGHFKWFVLDPGNIYSERFSVTKYTGKSTKPEHQMWRSICFTFSFVHACRVMLFQTHLWQIETTNVTRLPNESEVSWTASQLSSKQTLSQLLQLSFLTDPWLHPKKPSS